MSVFVKFGVRYFCLLAVAMWPALALAGGHAKTVDAAQPVKLTYNGKNYNFKYRGYHTPWVLDFATATGKRDTPFATLLGYYQTMKTMTEYATLMPYLRRANGDGVEKPKNTAQLMKAIETILAGDVLIFGEILYGDYTIYIYRYTKSIKRHLGLPIRKFGDRYFIVQDLVQADPLAARFSALRYNIDALKKRYPAAK